MSGFNSLVQNRIQASISNKHLTHGERSTIATLKRKNRSITYISNTLDSSVSTISRELRRNSCPAGRYCTEATGKLAASRAAAASCRASRTGAQRRAYVERRLT